MLYTTLVNSAFRMRLLASLEGLWGTLFTSKQPE